MGVGLQSYRQSTQPITLANSRLVPPLMPNHQLPQGETIDLRFLDDDQGCRLLRCYKLNMDPFLEDSKWLKT
jgi:hypothetical protein